MDRWLDGQSDWIDGQTDTPDGQKDGHKDRRAWQAAGCRFAAEKLRQRNRQTVSALTLNHTP
jgi:hypothetical protein